MKAKHPILSSWLRWVPKWGLAGILVAITLNVIRSTQMHFHASFEASGPVIDAMFIFCPPSVMFIATAGFEDKPLEFYPILAEVIALNGLVYIVVASFVWAVVGIIRALV